MKYVRIVLVVVASLAVLGVAGWYLIGWSVSRAFKSPTQEGDFRRLFDAVEASIGSTLAPADVQLRPGKAAGEGALAFYQKNPQALQRDRKYFETWSSALAIADAGRKCEHQTSRWESSTALRWIAPLQRTDSWGHAFCVQSDHQQTIVVSPGPQALSSLDCSTLKVSEDELAKMPRGRLNPHSSGVLILFVKTVSTRVPTGAGVENKPANHTDIAAPNNGTLHPQMPILATKLRQWVHDRRGEYLRVAF